MHTYTDITLTELESLRQQPDTLIVDVRDEWEFDEFNIGGLNIPLPDLRARKTELLPFTTLIAVCTNGARSRVAAKDFLRQPELEHKTIYHLHGGITEAVD
ncbi:rhodanese-like domain-containing protein [Spirosoma utsteinense]|uniref:Rhodanese-related sulfurtransferase n=1 Tax=Spirosoma utsteinense TaxID=2585773 RepID=A0ABR6W237_9BACT|nr:rhodanese-like domain-containing protein [Spirosoma utsteinense]MBC3785185.1 rhodanese-related sulfurtransferase [Spirosoma utsteinense]MBC3790590.1 rhodanese-related sulfurtransferase [Spirosoma utsteinense]